MCRLNRIIWTVLFLTTCIFPSFAQGTWERIAVPTTRNLNSLFFTDSITGWAAGDSGTILHTGDGGVSWTLQDAGTTNDIVEVFFLNADTGWASSYNYSQPPLGTLLLKTTDGGQTWTGTPFPHDNIFVTCITFSDGLNGWAGGKPHALMRTRDGGVTWTPAAIDTSILAFFPVLGIRFWNERYGYACGGMFDIAGVVWSTADSGNTWRALDASYAPADEVHELHLFDSLNVLGAGGDPDFGYGVGMIRTSDGGISWNYEELGVQGNAFDLDFRTPDHAWAPLGPRRKFVFSSDGGATWSAIDTPDSTAVYKLTFPDSLHGYAVGREGAMLRYKAAGGLSADPAVAVTGFACYPNPFSNSTEVRCRIPDAACLPARQGCRMPPACRQGRDAGITSISLEVMDKKGVRIMHLREPWRGPGEYRFTVNGEGLSGGVYICQLRVMDEKQRTIGSGTLRMIRMP